MKTPMTWAITKFSWMKPSDIVPTIRNIQQDAQGLSKTELVNELRLLANEIADYLASNVPLENYARDIDFKIQQTTNTLIKKYGRTNSNQYIAGTAHRRKKAKDNRRTNCPVATHTG